MRNITEKYTNGRRKEHKIECMIVLLFGCCALQISYPVRDDDEPFGLLKEWRMIRNSLLFKKRKEKYIPRAGALLWYNDAFKGCAVLRRRCREKDAMGRCAKKTTVRQVTDWAFVLAFGWCIAKCSGVNQQSLSLCSNIKSHNKTLLQFAIHFVGWTSNLWSWFWEMNSSMNWHLNCSANNWAFYCWQLCSWGLPNRALWGIEENNNVKHSLFFFFLFYWWCSHQSSS